MASENTVTWNLKDGLITLHREGDEQRLLLKRYDFVFSFMDEMKKVAGDDIVIMIFRRILELYGAPKELQDNPSIENAGGFLDDLVVPIDIGSSSIPDGVVWDGKTRNLSFFGSSLWRVLPISFIRNFREASYEILTENGTKAIVRDATRTSGAGMAQQAIEDYRLIKLEDLMNLQDEKVYLGTFRHAGWSYARVFTHENRDCNHMFLAKITNSYESNGMTNGRRPVCTWLMNYMDGFYNGLINELSGKFIETREVRCRAMGDPYCAFAHKIKDNKKDILDWRELESEWKELDAIPLSMPEG
ncbi:MAG: 4-vinyl reductase [Deltaproteobacteria bacterium]|nr:4-vinyl reductase [Candidatus Zymogenaceae bacterium]